MSKLDLPTIESALRSNWLGRPSGYANELWDTIDSTNSRAKELAAEGAPTGTLVLARQQTAGRGRLGRTWESPPGAGIYMSVILRSSERPLHDIPLVTIAAGVAAVRAIQQSTGVAIGLKWVNDLICDGCKVGGILAEAGGAGAPYVVLGMGINVFLDLAILPEELQSKVTSLHLHARDSIEPNAIVSSFCSELEGFWSALEQAQTAALLELWKTNSVTLGHRIRASIGERTVEGLAFDISGTGALKVRTDAGQEIELSAGEIQIRRADGAYC